jgi:DNA-binding FadR family transcriptional regulator
VRDFLRADLGPRLRPENHLDHARLVAAIRGGDEDTATREAREHAFFCQRARRA